MPAFSQPPGRPEAEASLLARYADAWSSGDPAGVGELHAAPTARLDTVFDQSAEDREAVEEYAAQWFDWYPDVTMDLVQPIAEASHEAPAVGGVFAIRPEGDGDSCVAQMAVLLETNENEELVGEGVYYDADSLVECAWAE